MEVLCHRAQFLRACCVATLALKTRHLVAGREIGGDCAKATIKGSHFEQSFLLAFSARLRGATLEIHGGLKERGHRLAACWHLGCRDNLTRFSPDYVFHPT